MTLFRRSAPAEIFFAINLLTRYVIRGIIQPTSQVGI